MDHPSASSAEGRRGTKSFQDAVDEDTARHANNNDHTLWLPARMHARALFRRFITSDDSVADLERNLHDLWYRFLSIAKITDAEHPAQDRLVAQVIFAKEAGTSLLECSLYTGKSTIISPDSWKDLPFLAQDIKIAWAGALEMEPRARKNLAGFIGRLISCGIQDVELGLCALWQIRETLEVPRRLAKATGQEAIKATDEEDGPSILDIFPACVAFVEQCNCKLLSFAIMNRSYATDSLLSSKPGVLLARYLESNEATLLCEGFSKLRWDFWVWRLQQIAEMFEGVDCHDGFKMASRCRAVLEQCETQFSV